MKKRVLSLLLVLVMLLGLLPTAALAAPGEEPPQAEGLTSDEIAQVPAVEEDVPATLGAATSPLTVELAGSSSCRSHHGDNWNAFGINDGDHNRASYDGGIVNVDYDATSISIYTKESGRFKRADYLYMPFTLSADVPAHSSVTYNFTVTLWHKRNSKGGVHYWLELLDPSKIGAASLNTSNNTVLSPGSLGLRIKHDNKDGGSGAFSWSVTFDNYEGTTAKQIDRQLAYWVGACKSTSGLSSYHHQVESSATFTVKSATTYKRITYNNNGGSGSTLAQSFSAGSTTLAPAPTKTGYDFLGWKDSADGKLYAAKAAYSQPRGAALTAQWAAKSLNVTFDPNGGTVSQSQKSVTYGETYGTLPTPTRTGYQFEGWTSGPTGGQVYYAHTRVTETKNHTLYAYWTVKVPTVTFNAGGGTVSQTSKRAVYGDPYGALPTPTRTGYTFDGWYTAQTGGNKVDSATKVANGDAHTLYARWTAKAVAVTLKYNDGATADGSLSLTYGGKYTGLTDPSRAGYAFTGWYTAASGGSRVTADTAVTNANAHTLYARWSRNTYTVTFNANGGSAVESRKVNAGDALGALPTSTKAGYTLTGWFSGDSQVTKDTVPTGDVTYTAKWTANQYTVTFNANGGKVSQTSMTVTSGLTYGTLPTPTRTGYTFNGWFTAATGGQEMTYNTYFQNAANQTLYAHWTANKYTVTLKVNDNGITADATREVTYGETYGANCVPAVTRTGYTLDGWYTAPVGGAKVATSTTVATASDHTLYAHWTAKTMTVTFDANGGEFPSEATTAKTVTYGQPYGSMPVPTREGKTFVGWYTAADKGAFRDASSLVNTDSDHTLYAHWGDTHSHTLGAGFTYASASFIALGQTTGSDKTAVSDVLGKEFKGTNSYFLTENVTIDTTTTVKGTLNLCLNGHSLTYNGTDDSIFVVENGGTLRICDCNGSHDSHTFTSPATGESVTISGGLITRLQPKTSVGTAIRVLGQGTLHLCNGTIAGIQAGEPQYKDDGITIKTIGDGAIRVEGTFHMYGGEICHNKIGCGAAVNICDTNGSTSHFYLHGGSIHHNYASLDDGGGVCVNQNAACTISGGSIVDNVAKEGGGGIHSYGGSIELSGNPVIQNNTTKTGGTNYNIRLQGGAKLTVGEGFSSAKAIGVSSTTAPTADAPVAVGTAGSGAYARYFVADAADQEVVDDNGVLSLKLHSHPVCGDGCSDHDGHTDVEYTALTQAMVDRLYNSTLSAGNYFLAEDITTPRTFSVQQGATVSLCLNGHTLETTRDSNGSNVITVSCSSSDSHSALNVCDCQGTGKVRAATCSGYYVSYNSSVNLYGGGLESRGTAASVLNDASLTVDGASLTSTESSGVYLNGTAKLLLKNGSITATADGKYGVNMSATGVSVQISGGSVSGGAEGAVYVKEASTLTLSGSPTIHATGDHDIYLNKSQAKIAAGDDLAGTYRLKMGYSATESFSPTITTASGRDHSAHFVLPGGSDYESLGLRDVENGDGTHTLQLYKLHVHDGEEYENYTVLPAGVEVLDDKRTLQSGKYLLTDDVDSTVIIPAGVTADLCLNGHDLTFLLDVRGTLNLYDCAQTPGTLCGNQSGYITVGTNGILNWYGGQMSGGKTIYGTVTLRGAMTSDISYLPVRFAPGVTITKDAPVIAAKNWTEHMGSSSMRYECENDKYAVAEVNGDGDLVLRLIQVTMDGKTVCPDYDTGTLTADDLAAPESRVGYLWDGWYTAETEGDKVTADTVFTDDATLYPCWTACDHSGNTNDKTTVPATCTTAGSESYTCSVCGLDVVTVTDALTHDFESDKTWHVDDPDSGVHYHKCARCDQRQDEAEHTWNGGAVTTQPTAEAEGVMTFTCTVCSGTTTQAIPALVAHSVTYTADDYTVGEAPTQADTVKGGVFSLPTGLTRTGYTLSGWALLDEEGVPGEDVLNGEFTMPDRDVEFQVRWERIPNYALQPGETIVLEDGTVIQNNTDNTVTIDQGGDGTVDATITLPDGGSVTVGQGENGKDQVTVPPGAQVETKPDEEGKNITITIKNDDGKVDTDGGVDAPAGSTVVDKNGNTITITEGSGGHIDPDGVVTFPEGEGGKVTVEDKDGNKTEVTVPGGGEGLDVTPGGVPLVQDKEDTITIPDGKGGSTTVTIPDPGPDNDGKSGNGADLDDQGGLVIPGGSTVTKTDGEGNTTTATVPDEGATLSGEGEVTLPQGGDVKVTDKDGNQITITVPAGGTVGIDEDGNVSAPSGSTITNPDGTVTDLPNGGTVKPGSGEVELKHNWDKWKLQADGKTLKRVCKTDAAHIQEKTLTFTVDEGPFTYTGTAQEPKVELKAQTAGEAEAETLRPGTDYTVAYEGNVNAGTGALTVTGQGSYSFTLERSFTIGKATVDPATLKPGSLNIANNLANEYVYTLTYLCPTISGSWGQRGYAIESVVFEKDGYYTDGAARIDKLPGGDYANRLFLPIRYNNVKTTGVVGTVTIRFTSENYQPYTNTVRVVASNKSAVAFSGLTTPDKTYDAKPYAPAGTAVTKRQSDGYVVSADVEVLYTGRNDTSYSPADEHTPPTDAGEYALTLRVRDTDPYYIGRDTYNFRINKAPGVGSVTMAGYTEGQKASEPVAASQTNGTDHVSYLYKVKGGADSGYTAVRPTRAGEYTLKATFAATRNYTEATATADFTVAKADLPPDPNLLKPGQSVDLPGGGSAENKGEGQVELTDQEGNKTIITLPEDGDGTVKVDKGAGTVTIPGGSTVTTPDGNGGKTQVTVPQDGEATVKPGGEVTLPGGGKVDITDKDGNQTTVTIPGAGGTVKPTEDGKVEVPGGSTVTKPDGSTVTTPSGGGVIDPGTGDVTPVKPSRPSSGHPSSGRQPNREEETKQPEETKPTVDQFTDVKPQDWFYDSVKTIVAQGLMNGTGETAFSPGLDTSRAMIATILWRLEGSPEPKATLTYPDCVKDSWYAQAVAWCSEQGVVKGYGNGDFGPDDPITREQLAVMLWRYAQAKGRDVSVGEDTNILSYVDFGQIGEWAIPALQWAVGSGVISGKGGGILDPVGRATRAEAATMLARYLELQK